ncbi:sulfotransferase family protein [Aestuariivivens sediminis]|uniref:sulfotransferase family protein n=1 Tax=Aestuariivivens sediminis TaxID=2913557 RepID=UPI001F5AE837|nr:sulfotransferase [Aestuariivivens sediminis]
MENQPTNPLLWQSQTPEKLPDFIIGGAMKSGTSTLHNILNSHPQVAMAHEELGFLDMDEWLQHPDYHFYDRKAKLWKSTLLVPEMQVLWDWYYSQFPKRTDHMLVGEDSTTYLASPRVAERLAMQKKAIKVIFILRHPTKRALSNYLHAVKSGRALYSLEDTLKYDPHSILKRSLYKEQLDVYYKHLPSEQIKVVLFEDFLRNKAEVIKAISTFLNLDFKAFDASNFDLHINKTKTPKYFRLQLLRNRFLKHKRDVRYAKMLPKAATFVRDMPLSYKVLNKLHGIINPLGDYNNFVVNPKTEILLDAYFKKALQGIDEIVGAPVMDKWFKA